MVHLSGIWSSTIHITDHETVIISAVLYIYIYSMLPSFHYAYGC